MIRKMIPHVPRIPYDLRFARFTRTVDFMWFFIENIEDLSRKERIGKFTYWVFVYYMRLLNI